MAELSANSAVDANELATALRSAGLNEVETSALQRALYSTDASIYRVPPSAVAFPRDSEEVAAAVSVCAGLGVPLTMRGAGTSIAGNAIGTGLVLDVSRHMNTVINVDPDARTARVQPGVVQADLQSAVAKHGLRFGPDPSTSNRCTIGGMIGNNACGSRALAYGRTSDNVIDLDVVAGNGERLRLGRPNARTTDTISASSTLDALHSFSTDNAKLIEANFGRFSRQVSGYALEQLLPRHDFDVARALVGSEGTLALTLEATVRLVSDPPERNLVALGYPTMADAADAVPAILIHQPTACEGLDARIVDAVRTRFGVTRVPPLPEGSGWLFVEVVGSTRSEVDALSQAVIASGGALDSLVVSDAAHINALWRIREDGAGLASRTPDGRPAYAGWEDAAVPPASLGNYLRDFDALLAQHDLMGMPYGHFGDGCVHVRLDFPLGTPHGTDAMRAFLTDAANLVVSYGGSLSGEHGDGRARGELLSVMYDAHTRDLFGQVKSIFDPSGILNPGVIVAPRPLDADVRMQQTKPVKTKLAFGYKHDDGDFSKAVHRCTGVGKCRADITGAGGVMCPSFIATRNEKDSTRGRARVLQEMINTSVVTDAWRSPEVHEALDLCLSCKGCSTDCPTGVDMATYKAEVLHQTYKGRVRPRSHYALGWLPSWARIASRLPGVANRLLTAPLLSSLGKRLAGVDTRRSLPVFAPQTFRQWFATHSHNTSAAAPEVALWVDTFTNHFSPEVGVAAVRVLEDAGYRVSITNDQVCCGLTWISTGQLDTARKRLNESVEALTDFVSRNVPIVGLEPSCTAALRSDLPELLGSKGERTSSLIRTLAQQLNATEGWTPPDLSSINAVAQPHCHHSAVMGWQEDASLLEASGATVNRLGGCCGLAGNFGVEAGHYDVSVAVAEHQLLPAVTEAGEGTWVLADGFSCRTQLEDLAARPSLHLAQLLESRLPPKGSES